MTGDDTFTLDRGEPARRVLADPPQTFVGLWDCECVASDAPEEDEQFVDLQRPMRRREKGSGLWVVNLWHLVYRE